jgi:hypothetical protein
MKRSKAPHLRISTPFTEPGRPPLPEPGVEPRIAFAVRGIPLPADIPFGRKVRPSLQFSVRFPSHSSQTNSQGFSETPKSNFSAVRLHHVRAKVTSNSLGRPLRSILFFSFLPFCQPRCQTTTTQLAFCPPPSFQVLPLPQFSSPRSAFQ